MVRTSFTVVAISCALLASGAVFAQDIPLSEKDVRCFIEGCKGFRLAKPQTGSPVAQSAAPKMVTTPQVAPGKPRRRPVAAPVVPDLPTDPENTLNMRLNFEMGSATLTESSLGQVDMFARVLANKDIKTRFVIAGHTDASGARAYNLSLSRRRANAVVDYLVKHGVDKSLLKPVGYGPDRPLGDVAAEDPSNRRVEIVKLAGK